MARGTKTAKAASAILFAALLTVPAMTTSDSHAIEGCNTTMTTKIDQYYQGPVFVDAYWTESNMSLSNGSGSSITEREVGPGEGRATLAVVLLNRSTGDISAAVGYLRLPEGFEPAGTSVHPESRTVIGGLSRYVSSNQHAVASHNSVITAKSSFTLYFDVNILDSAAVGTKMTELVVQYYRATDPGLCTSAQIKFPMILSGKTILDVLTDGSYLTPKVPNTVNISIVNKGTADAMGVVAFIVGLGESDTRSQTNEDDSVTLRSAETELINLGENTFSIGTIPAGGGVTISTVIFPSKDAAGKVQNMDVLLSYGNAYGNKQNVVIGTGLVISPNPIDSSLNIVHQNSDNSHILTAEKLAGLDFVITNNNPSTMSNVIISITPQSDALTIVGDSKWSFPLLEQGQQERISTRAIAAKSMIGSPTSFTINGSYIIDGEEKSDSLRLGTFVSGDVNLHVYDLTVNYVGNAPNIVGSILNQGNTAALYTSVDLVSAVSNEDDDAMDGGHAFASETGPALVPSQYVGDVSADSSIPFSIPLGNKDILKPGSNTVTLKIAYADNLKNFHDLMVESQIDFEPRPNPADSRRQASPLDDLTQNPIFLVAIAGAIAVALIAVKKKKSRKGAGSQSKFESDIESLLDQHAKDREESNPK